jgi:CRP-like cAMP-binding protein
VTSPLSSPPETPAAALRKIDIFSDLSDEQLQWFVASANEIKLSPGDVVIREGDPADALFVLLEGEIRGRRENGGADTPGFVARSGQVTGLLPFSRLTVFPMTARATVATWGLRLHKDHFQEMLQRIPELLARLIGVMADRIREYSRAEQQRDKLSALGKLSAGLAHELNNPASAAARAAEGLREAMQELRKTNKLLDDDSLSCEERSALASLEEILLDQLTSRPPLDALEQSDMEQELAIWLERRNIANASRLASARATATACWRMFWRVSFVPSAPKDSRGRLRPVPDGSPNWSAPSKNTPTWIKRRSRRWIFTVASKAH